MMILLLFFLSGATALIYEVVWSKYLTLMFGSTVQAQTVVLSVFMGGLALGNRLFGRRADQARQPLLLYAYLEIAIGLFALFFQPLFNFADAAYVAVGSHLLEHKTWLLLLKGLLSVALLLGPTVLMGGTLPLVAAWLQRESTDAGRRSARFYATNSLGAVFGAGLAGFYLVKTFGLGLTVQLTAAGNVLIGIIALGIVRYQSESLHGPRLDPGKENPAGASQVPALVGAAAETSRRLRWGCAMVAITGAVSMGLEVLAARFLTLIFGASLQAFAVVLMAFILGIALGSSVASSPRFRRWQAETVGVVLLLVTAALIGLLVMSIEEWVELYRYAKTGLARTTAGYHFHQVLTAAMSMIVLGLPAALLGAVLPLWIRSVSEGASVLGERVGRLLTWNTMGAVVGVLLTGFVLMPAFGLRGSFGFMAVALTVTGAVTAWKKQQRAMVMLSGTLALLLVMISLTGGDGWKYVMSTGMFRVWGTEVRERTLDERRRDVTILFYEDAADATVSVEQMKEPTPRPALSLRINGKTDASTIDDLGTQYLLAHVPMMARPAAKDVFVLGFGSGITAGSVLGYPVERVTIAENCEPVLRAGKLFEDWNRGVLTNSRVHLWNEDARTVLKLSPNQYDVIISEPSNPWMAGIGSVFSQEFYELAARRLKEGGLMAQWFHLYEMHDGIVSLVLHTFRTVFPYVEIWDAGPGDIILLGSKQPWPMSPEVFRKSFEWTQPREELESIGLRTPASVWTRQIASQRTGFAIAEDVGVQSDEFPVLEYAAPEAFFLGRNSGIIARYDERTVQSELAAPEKSVTLKSLAPAQIREAFANNISANIDLQQYLLSRFPKGSGETASHGPPPIELYKGTEPQLCLFFPWKLSSLKEVPVPANASEVLEQLMVGEALLLNSPTNWLMAVDAIEIEMRSLSNDPIVSSQALARFAGAAMRASLFHGDYERARRMLALGVQLDPLFSEFGYFTRILERELSVSAPRTSQAH